MHLIRNNKKYKNPPHPLILRDGVLLLYSLIYFFIFWGLNVPQNGGISILFQAGIAEKIYK